MLFPLCQIRQVILITLNRCYFSPITESQVPFFLNNLSLAKASGLDRLSGSNSNARLHRRIFGDFHGDSSGDSSAIINRPCKLPAILRRICGDFSCDFRAISLKVLFLSSGSSNGACVLE